MQGKLCLVRHLAIIYRDIHLMAQHGARVEHYGCAAHTVSCSFRLESLRLCQGEGRQRCACISYILLKVGVDKKSKVGLFCSDVQGAFDRVAEARIGLKLKNTGLTEYLVGVLMSWLQSRSARVIVEGDQSDLMT